MILKCQDCSKENETVEHTFCPYEEEINDEIVSITVCTECYHNRCADI